MTRRHQNTAIESAVNLTKYLRSQSIAQQIETQQQRSAREKLGRITSDAKFFFWKYIAA